ncbi:hypothetical protein I551_8918 [Mycobacterium ulcerans str. Harvey]|uniref:ATP synthase B/B' CF family protein n=1 Tax=Mycobacterium ulcerans str. Harvey TaxID=1299332 RepID=A0ABN0R9F5_MYCUL|nr:hypothetical protein I551_8918 [Mycobacterium ulcerans str. Harvey]
MEAAKAEAEQVVAEAKEDAKRITAQMQTQAGVEANGSRSKGLVRSSCSGLS